MVEVQAHLSIFLSGYGRLHACHVALAHGRKARPSFADRQTRRGWLPNASNSRRTALTSTTRGRNDANATPPTPMSSAQRASPGLTTRDVASPSMMPHLKRVFRASNRTPGTLHMTVKRETAPGMSMCRQCTAWCANTHCAFSNHTIPCLCGIVLLAFQ